MTNQVSKQASVSHLQQLLANSYSLYLQTQNYHWNVRGPLFFSLHQLFEAQYTQLATFVDDVAERIRALGEPAPATLAEFAALTTLPEEPAASSAKLKAEQMVQRLLNNQEQLLSESLTALQAAEANGDVATVDTFTQAINLLEKNSWMLRTVIE